jgi:hypothetical protein
MEPAVSLVARQRMPPRSFHEPAPDVERSRLLSRAGALPLACAACAVAAAAYVAVEDPGDDALLPCPVRALTGQWCPGCGLTRATHHLFRGNVAQALSFNVFAPLILTALLALWAVWLSVATDRGVPRLVMALRVRSYVTAGIVLATFTVVRNLAPFSALRGG